MYAICVWGDADNQTDTIAHESAFGWQQVKLSVETWARCWNSNLLCFPIIISMNLWQGNSISHLTSNERH